MAVLFTLLLFALFLGIEWFGNRPRVVVPRGTVFTTPGYEWLGALAQDGGKLSRTGKPVVKETFLGAGI